MIYGRFGDPLTIVRMAVIDDVKALDGRKPDVQDRQAISVGSYVVVRYADTGKDALYHIGHLRADDGSKEIQAALRAVES